MFFAVSTLSVPSRESCFITLSDSVSDTLVAVRSNKVLVKLGDVGVRSVLEFISVNVVAVHGVCHLGPSKTLVLMCIRPDAGHTLGPLKSGSARRHRDLYKPPCHHPH